MTCTLSFDGRALTGPADQPLIDFLAAHGINLPHVCYHTALGPLQTCDVCWVETQGKLVRGCTLRSREGLQVTTRGAHAASARDAVMETEFGATNDIPYLGEMVSRADRFMVPWLEWAYCGCSDPTTSGPGTKQAIVIDPSKPPAGSNLELPTLRALVEPYPQVIGGTPTSWSFTRSSRTFRLRFSTQRAGHRSRFRGRTISEIATPGLVYGGRYSVAVTGGYAVSRRGASTLRIASCRHAKTVTVTVAPGHGTGSACQGPKRRR